jgi:hypothetical protein
MPIEQEPDATNSFKKTAVFRFFWPVGKNPKTHLKMNKRKKNETQPETVNFFTL